MYIPLDFSSLTVSSLPLRFLFPVHILSLFLALQIIRTTIIRTSTTTAADTMSAIRSLPPPEGVAVVDLTGIFGTESEISCILPFKI